MASKFFGYLLPLGAVWGLLLKLWITILLLIGCYLDYYVTFSMCLAVHKMKVRENKSKEALKETTIPHGVTVMKWLKTKDQLPADKEEILLSVSGISYVSIYKKINHAFFIENGSSLFTFKGNAKDLYWMPFNKSPFIGKPIILRSIERYKSIATRAIAISKIATKDELENKKSPKLMDIIRRQLADQKTANLKVSTKLATANKKINTQRKEKTKRAVELIIANKEKGKRAGELITANKELAFQNKEKGKRADELIIANKELVYQNKEKGKRSAELVIANKELVYQNKEKGKRADELVVANTELIFQNEEKKKRAEELLIANKELLAFTYVSSHDLQEPLRKIQTFAGRITETEYDNLSERGKDYFARIQSSAGRMQQLLLDLLEYSQINHHEGKFEKTDLNEIIEQVKIELKEIIEEKGATITSEILPLTEVIPYQFRQLMQNIISNALKFSKPEVVPIITINSRIVLGREIKDETLSPDKEYCHIMTKDNGIGFDQAYSYQIFEVFKRLHGNTEYVGTGMGLAIVKKIVENHNGIIHASGALKSGAFFDIYLPQSQTN